MMRTPVSTPDKPSWLKRKIPSGTTYQGVLSLLKRGRLHTVCQEALCPNMGECFSRGTATFLILGNVCTRSCRFCAVRGGQVEPPDPDEPARLAETVRTLGLRYVVITSVTRDDLPDGGAGHFARTISSIRRLTPQVRIEILVPDFGGSEHALMTVIGSHPDMFNHNIETVPRLYSIARPEADYRRSLRVLNRAHSMDPGIPTKSGLMLGMGETDDEIRQTLADILDADCRILTLGQYLKPTGNHLPVARYIPPEEFDRWRETAREMGFRGVVSGPFVRSSYQAELLYRSVTH